MSLNLLHRIVAGTAAPGLVVISRGRLPVPGGCTIVEIGHARAQPQRCASGARLAVTLGGRARLSLDLGRSGVQRTQVAC